MAWAVIVRAKMIWKKPSSFGSGSVILLRPKIGLAPQKHDVISMQRQQYTNTKHIPIGSYHPVVSIMLRHMDPKKNLVKICVAAKWKSTKSWGGGWLTVLFSNATTFRNDCDNKRSFRMKQISKPRKYKSHLGIDRIGFETPERRIAKWRHSLCAPKTSRH